MSYSAEINPIIKLDYPDPDVIRVGDTYYMVSTTMHFMPGCEILRSYDLINWEHAAFVYETLDGTPAQRLEDGLNIYGKGMWAACIRFHEGRFYVCFAANDTKKTYIYTAEDVSGPWKKQYIEGFYHDCSLLFDDDGRVYIVSGNKQIWLTELKKDLSGPLPGGLKRMIVNDEGHPGLGYEGSHIYKIDGFYYVFFIHSRRDCWKRVQACFMSDSPNGEFTGGDVLEDDRNYHNQGAAQGGIVDTPDGRWYAVLFQDYGAVGRVPVLVPITWKDRYPVFGCRGKIPADFPVYSTRPDYRYRPLTGSDDFSYIPDQSGRISLDPRWQFNHEPDPDCFEFKNNSFRLTAEKICDNLTQAVNTLTQRMQFPSCSAKITVDAGELKEGDYAGLCILSGCYGMAAVTRRNGCLYVVMKERTEQGEEIEREAIRCPSSEVNFKVTADFGDMKDEACFYYHDGTEFRPIGGRKKLYFRLDHFCGCRFGLFLYATEQTGGKVAFRDFVYERLILSIAEGAGAASPSC